MEEDNYDDYESSNIEEKESFEDLDETYVTDIDEEEETIDEELVEEKEDDFWIIEETDELDDGTNFTENELCTKKICNKKTRPYLNKYEFTKIIGIRAEQIINGAQVLVSTNQKDPIKIALIELKEKRLPFLLRRRILDKNKEFIYEDWSLDNMKNLDSMIEYYSY